MRIDFRTFKEAGMRIRPWFALACGAALFAAATIAAGQTGGSAVATDWEGLVKVKSKRFDSVYLLPGADFRGYTKVMLDPTQVAFAKNWMKDINDQRIALLRRITVEDAERIAEQARTGFGDIFSNALKSAGYEIVVAPGADVLRLSPRVINMYINAPEPVTTAPLTRVYTVDAGEATLALEARDSTTGALLGRVVDRRTAGARGAAPSSLRITSPASNRFDFGNVFDVWARSYVKGLDELKTQSPVATTVPAH